MYHFTRILGAIHRLHVLASPHGDEFVESESRQLSNGGDRLHYVRGGVLNFLEGAGRLLAGIRHLLLRIGCKIIWSITNQN